MANVPFKLRGCAANSQMPHSSFEHPRSKFPYFCSMAFSPLHSPVYGGETLTIGLDSDQVNPADGRYFVVFEGTRRRHVVSAHAVKSAGNCLYAIIPGHDVAEDVQITLVKLRQDSTSYLPLAQCYFRYEYDTTFYLTKFLTSSVYNDQALETLELIKSDRFDLSNEVLSTLDIRLSRALLNANLSSSWHLLGGDSISDTHCEVRETLLHFCARLGLRQVAAYLLDQPGSEDALKLPNRHGELPCTIARQNGFHDLAEMLSGYNTQGMVTTDQGIVEMDNAVLRNYSNGTSSLTSYIDSPTLESSVENELNFLKETEEMMRVQRGFLPPRYESDWPKAPALLQTGSSRSMPSLPMDQEMELTLDRILHQQIINCNTIHSFLRTSSLPASDGGCDDGRQSRDTGSFDESGDGGVSDGDGGPNTHKSPVGPMSLRPPAKAEDSLTKLHNPYSVLEYSLSGIRDLAEDLFQLRDYQLPYRLASRELRKRHLSRHSSSCPSLKEPIICLGVKSLRDGDHHKSMHDLMVADLKSSQQHSTDQPQVSPYSSSPNTGSLYREGSLDQGIRICVNGVTVDSTEDFPPSVSPSRAPQDTGGPPHRKYSRLRDGLEQEDMLDGKGSWTPSNVTSGRQVDRRDQSTRVRMLAMTGRSLSLTSLEGSEESEEEDFTGPLNDDGSYVGIPIPSPRPVTSRGASPVDSTGSSSAGREVPEPGVVNHSRLGDLTLSSQNARSMCDLTITPESALSLLKEVIHQGSPESHLQGSHHFEDNSLGVPHSSMTKSLSTPSIPVAMEVSGDSSHNVKDRTGKHDEVNTLFFGSYSEDYDAQIQRQKEIEEEEEDDGYKKTDKSMKDFLNEEVSHNDSDEKSSKTERKDDKKRKPNMFARLHNSVRTKKNKEKETKSKERHHFVSISISNSTVCDVCHKPMANKPSLKCENCLVNVHEHNCKDQVTLCDKTRSKALYRDGSSHGPHSPTQPAGHGSSQTVAHVSSQGTLPDRSFPPPTGSSIRHNSFKDKRSESAPTKSQSQSQLPPPLQQTHRHSMPSLFGSPPNNVINFVQWQAANTGRFSVLDKAISEESESDAMTSGQQTTLTQAQTNMTDTISESMESLDAVVPTETSWLDEEPDLQLSVEEPEAWSITVDRKTIKKMTTKDIKRQDIIWELINTEKQYVKRLKIMQKIFSHAMLHEMNYTSDQVDRLFPRLDELLELHSNFLRQLLLRQTKNEDRSIDEIGDILMNQFGDTCAEKMKAVYGVFCSRHTEAMQLYKEFIKLDRRFQHFARKCTNLPVCEKRDISDFILGVTVRLSKYPILIEAIHKGTKDKKDRENLSQALLLCKDVVQHVDEKVAAYDKLMDIQSKLDSRAVLFKGKKFKRQDLNADNRELVHAGKIGWKSARGQVYDVLAVVLTDLILFLQKKEQKYTFLMQDNKSCVIPLYKLLVREKRDAKDSLGIYMISQNRTTPEMYELVCQSKAEREEWIRILQDAVKVCPPELEPELWPASHPGPVTITQEEDKRRKDEHASNVKVIIEELHKKDKTIKELCDEKNKLMVELWELSTTRNDNGSRPNSQEILTGTESMEIVQAAMQEASRLATICQVSGTQLSRSVSSVGEHHSNTFVATPVPKRAETFAGFDSTHDSPKLNAMKQRFVGSSGFEGDEGRSPSVLSLDQTETDSILTENSLAGKDVNVQDTKTTSSAIPVICPPLHQGVAHLWEEQISSDRSSDRGSVGELSAASVSSLIASPSNQDQMTSLSHLVYYLNTLMNLTSKQCTTVESLRAELAEAKEEIAKLSADMHQGRRTIYRHDQLEELRNLQENISRERQEWERTKLQDRSWLEKEREKLETERREMEKEKLDLRNRKEDLKREREALQRQIDMMREQGYQVSSSFGDQNADPMDLDKMDNGGHNEQRPIAHRRSASADFYSTVVVSDVENIQNFVPGVPRQPRLSVGNVHNQNLNTVAPGKQPVLPVHLLSARNEQRIGGKNVQRLPLKLAGNTNHSAISPSAAFCAGYQQPFPSRAGGSTTINRVQSMSVSSNPLLGHHQENNRSAPSGLAKVMKLADPKGKSSQASTTTGSVSTAVTSTSKTPNPQSGVAPAVKNEDRKDGSDEVIYF
ncbi:unnamed protein product [Lymnaea stagnalis]|uniref:Rho guanine nucleotide exchange factor 28 n=1 Tax=Lymnaea stagnalis TaxID=6523 RepID=A0AAV2HV24_LYMST